MAAKRKMKKVSRKSVKKTVKDTPEMTGQKPVSRPSNKKYLVLVVALVLLGVLVYLSKSVFVAALVGGRPISRLSLVRELEKQGGKQTLEDLITKELIDQEAKKGGINISNEEVQEEINRLSGLVSSQGTTLDAALATQGQTMEGLEENIRVQKTVERLLKDSVSVSDDEIKKYFDENKSFYGEDPKFEELKDQISEQLKQQKISTEFKNWLEKLKSESDVVYFVNF